MRAVHVGQLARATLLGFGLLACGGGADAGVDAGAATGGAAALAGQATGGSSGSPSAAGGAAGTSLSQGGAVGGADLGGATTGGATTAGSPSGGNDGGAGGVVGGSGGGGGPAPDLAASYHYTCNLIIGIQTTSEWFREFDNIVDIERWEMMHKDSAHLDKWADPKNALWSLPKEPACAQHPEEPERVVFMGVNYDYTTVEEFLPDYVAVIENIKAQYPSAKRVDVMTYTRAPQNMECESAGRSAYSYIKPAQDEAITQLVAKYPGFVYATPRWEVASCADFNYCPHLTGDANKAVAKTLATYFDGK